MAPVINTVNIMDYSSEYLSESSELSEHSLLGELNNNSVYPSSPNSFYYEQEKFDHMQNSVGRDVLSDNTPLMCSNNLSEDFDLQSHYENSRDLCLSQSDTPSNILSRIVNPTSLEEYFKCEKSNMDIVEASPTEPTLAELNTCSEENSLIDVGSFTDLVSSSRGKDSKSPVTLEYLHNVKPPVTTTVSWDVGMKETEVSKALASTWSGQESTQNVGPVYSLSSVTMSQPMVGTQTPRTLTSRGQSVGNLPLSDDEFNTDVQSFPNRRYSDCLGSKRESQSTKHLSQCVPAGEPTFLDKKWEEIKHFIHDEDSRSKTQTRYSKRPSRGSLSSTISNDNSDDGSDSDVQGMDTDSDYEVSDEEWSGGQSGQQRKHSNKEQQYFWQYNIQSKGPKGKRVNFGLDHDPHKFQDFEDPVFDTSTASQLGTSIRHGGKARKGDGNDIAPNPKKLVQIGSQLKRLNKQINGFAPLSELPVSTRNKSKKEKNKLASRACRLKKKAQHEANKVKLHGLDLEHKQLLQVITAIREDLLNYVNSGTREKSPGFTKKLEKLMQENLKTQVAGSTADYVNQVIKKVEEGDTSGGLDLRGS